MTDSNSSTPKRTKIAIIGSGAAFMPACLRFLMPAPVDALAPTADPANVPDPPVAAIAALTVDNAEHAEVAISMAEQGMKAGGTQAPIGVLAGAGKQAAASSLDEAYEMAEQATGSTLASVTTAWVADHYPPLLG